MDSDLYPWFLKIFEEITSAVEKGYIVFNDRVAGSSPVISTKRKNNWECSSAGRAGITLFVFCLIIRY